jgi:TrpR-related protein YerC/YecD
MATPSDDIFENSSVAELLKALLLLESESDAKSFLRDLLTENELKEFAMRWQVARMLHEKLPYSHIERETGLSSTTIARISKWLSTGTGGYQKMLEKFAQLP